MFVEMLADPYPLEPEFKVRLLKVKPVHVQAALAESGRVALSFGEQVETISMSRQNAAKLGEDVAKLSASLAGANPS